MEAVGTSIASDSAMVETFAWSASLRRRTPASKCSEFNDRFLNVIMNIPNLKL
jgi:hypothetical protein